MAPRKKPKKTKLIDILDEAAEIAALPAAEQDRLNEERVKEFLRLSPSDIEMLDAISKGNVPKNAAYILQALRMKLEHTVRRPEPTPQVSAGGVTVVVQTLGDKAPQVAILPDDEIGGLQ